MKLEQPLLFRWSTKTFYEPFLKIKMIKWRNSIQWDGMAIVLKLYFLVLLWTYGGNADGLGPDRTKFHIRQWSYGRNYLLRWITATEKELWIWAELYLTKSFTCGEVGLKIPRQDTLTCGELTSVSRSNLRERWSSRKWQHHPSQWLPGNVKRNPFRDRESTRNYDDENRRQNFNNRRNWFGLGIQKYDLDLRSHCSYMGWSSANDPWSRLPFVIRVATQLTW